VPKTIDLSNRVALVTGAGTGIGAGIAVGLAEAGADVGIHHHGDRSDAERTAEACRVGGGRAYVCEGDFAADPSSAAAAVESTAHALGSIDILVNNAGVTTKRAPFLTHSQALFEEILAVNVTAAFLATQAAARRMIAQGGWGRVINIGSVHARASAPERVAYEVSKGAILALTFSSAAELGKQGITVNCVAPGVIVVERYVDFNFDLEWYLGRHPVGRLGTPADIAAAVVFLASDDAGFVTGETLFVDGGMTRRMALVK
jgi:NAD(P)-dependent dehydrogenase (short-subunit alcohol dehydrogenase family)